MRPTARKIRLNDRGKCTPPEQGECNSDIALTSHFVITGTDRLSWSVTLLEGSDTEGTCMSLRKVVGYLRVSTTEQVEGFGLDVQRKAIEEYCRKRRLRLVDVLSDEGQSGSNGLDRRVGLAEALALVERGDVKGIVVYRLDRLARDLLLQETVMGRMRSAGAVVLSVTEPDVDSDDATRVLVRQVLGAISQYERAVIKGRMMAGKAAKVATGGYGGGRPAFGKVAKDKSLVDDVDERQTIELIRRLRDKGLSLRQIAEHLEQAGLHSKSGQHWFPTQVKRVLDRISDARSTS
jgi:DNA invertase Pin-like site-specific DNA recombinase